MSFSKWSEKRLKLASCGHELTHEVSKQLFAKFYLQDGILGVLYRRACHMGGRLVNEVGLKQIDLNLDLFTTTNIQSDLIR